MTELLYCVNGCLQFTQLMLGDVYVGIVDYRK